MGIYQEIWNADQEENGVEAILKMEEGSQEHGYVLVNAKLDKDNSADLKVLGEVHIPDHKKSTYEACLRLFNNYSLAESMEEFDTAQERQEVHDFVSLIIDTKPMQTARAYIEKESNSTISQQRWYNTIVEMWFRKFSMGGDPALSGFEHVIVGEQEKSKVQGYHFWWKYYLDDGFANKVDDGSLIPPGLSNDRISYHGSRMKKGQIQFPESVTISYRWQAPDYENMAVRPLFKKIGGFFVGCSVEGLIALGTVRAHKGIHAPTVAVIEGARYEMKLYHSTNNQHIRTFYPMFLGPADVSDGGTHNPPVIPDPIVEPSDDESTTEIQSSIRIIGAKINPTGHDVGLESVVLVNVGPINQVLNDWCLKDKNENTLTLKDKMISSGEFLSIPLDGRDVQLSNRGGSIRLLNNDGKIVQQVSYSKTQAQTQGVTVLF